jgi:hypothetical protein
MRVQIKPDSGMGMYFVHVGGQQVGRVYKRVESYSGIMGGKGRRLGSYTYWDYYAEADLLAKLGSETARKRAVASLLIKLGYFEEALPLDMTHALNVIGRSRCGKWYRAADGDRYVCTLAPHNDDVEHDGVRVSSG